MLANFLQSRENSCTMYKSDRHVAAELIAAEAVSEINIMYGPESNEPLPYHDREHTLDVIRSGTAIAQLALRAGRIDDDDIPLLLIAESMHDYVKTRGATFKQDEIASAAAAQDKMSASGEFSDNDIRTVGRIIISSAARTEGDRIIQNVTRPDPLAEIIADADLSHLGSSTPDYWSRSRKLFDEMFSDCGPEGLRSFIALQPRILRNHCFYTFEARELFPYHKRNIVVMEKLLEKLNEDSVRNSIVFERPELDS
jgi:predicted metal-dependent HD superfamily phosphohydrolase